jgi:hypothetical protein
MNKTPRPGSNDAPAGTTFVPRRRALVYVLVVSTSVAAVLGYAGYVIWRTNAEVAAAQPIAGVPLPALPTPAMATAKASADAASSRPYMLFRTTALGEHFGRVSLAYLDALGEPRSVSPLSCDRVHFAANMGICLEAVRKNITSYRAHIFDREFNLRHTVPLHGPPSRARVSPDGRLAAFTVFVSGHSYDSPGFTTRSSIIDTASGRLLLEDLETMPVFKDGAPFKSVDFNFWGVTFAMDGRRFYATLGTAGKAYLVEGNLDTRQMKVLHDDVECPSISPDNTRIAFKRRQAMDSAGRRLWRVLVLDLGTGKEVRLDKEIRNVDDQVEWLNNHEILYAMPKSDAQAGSDVWSLRTDAGSPPRLLLQSAFSPAVTR